MTEIEVSVNSRSMQVCSYASRSPVEDVRYVSCALLLFHPDRARIHTRFDHIGLYHSNPLLRHLERECFRSSALISREDTGHEAGGVGSSWRRSRGGGIQKLHLRREDCLQAGKEVGLTMSLVLNLGLVFWLTDRTEEDQPRA